jgi:LmbE family N-acetylglucosaminyl deacetylase
MVSVEEEKKANYYRQVLGDEKMRVLVLSPHTDDAELGCGATVAKHVLNGDIVKWVTFSPCRESLPEEWREPNKLCWEQDDAMFALDIDDWIILDYPVRYFRECEGEIRHLIWRLVSECFRPDIIYTPWRGSLHQDHEVVSRCTEQVTRHRNIRVLGYYVCDDGIGFAPRYFEELDDENMKELRMMPNPVMAKLAALECYQSQRELRTWWNQGVFRATLKYWAPCTTAKYAEAFEIIREVSK